MTLLLCLVFLSSCQVPDDKVSVESRMDQVVGSVGDQDITLGELEKEIALYQTVLKMAKVEPKEGLARLRKALLVRVVENVVLEREANRQGITVSNDELDNEIRVLLGEYDKENLGMILAENNMSFGEWKKYLSRTIKVRKLTVRHMDSVVSLSDEEIKKYFDENASDFRWSARVRALQIMVNDETTAEQVREKLIKKGDFSAMAKKVSQSPDAVAGGDLGFFSRGQMPPEFENAVFRLDEGEISRVIKSIYGFHLFKVIKKEDPRAMTFSEARERIKEILITQRREEEFTSWIISLKKKESVIVYPEILQEPSPS